MKRALDQLVRIAELRADLARREVVRAQTGVCEAQERRVEAEAGARALARDQAARREILRSPLLGSPQLRGAIEGVLNTSRADIEREAAATALIREAEAGIEAALVVLASAKASLLAAEQKRVKRHRLRQPVLHRLALAAEMRAEAEAEDRSYEVPK